MTEAIRVEDPIKYGWAHLTRQAVEWMAENQKALLVFYEPVNAINLETKERYLEMNADLVEPGDEGALTQREVFHRLTLTMKVNEAKIEVPK